MKNNRKKNYLPAKVIPKIEALQKTNKDQADGQKIKEIKDIDDDDTILTSHNRSHKHASGVRSNANKKHNKYGPNRKNKSKFKNISTHRFGTNHNRKAKSRNIVSLNENTKTEEEESPFYSIPDSIFDELPEYYRPEPRGLAALIGLGQENQDK